MVHENRRRGVALGAAAFIAMMPAAALADENCVHLDFFVKGKWMPVFDVSTWASGHPSVDFGKLRLKLQPDGVATYEDRLNNRETKSTWQVTSNSAGMERLCLPNNPFDPELECSAVYKATAANDPATLLSFDSQCANGEFGSEVFVGAEQGSPEAPAASPRESEAATSDEGGARTQADVGSEDSAIDEQTNGQLPKCSADAVEQTVSSLVASIPLDPGQVYALAPVGPHKLTFTVKAVRTEGELLNGYSCSAVVTANVDTSGNPKPINPLAIPMLQSQGLIGDRNIDYSIEMMDDGQVMVTLEP